MHSLLIVSNADNCSTLYYSIYCCKKKEAALLLYTIRSYCMWYVFILIDNMFSKKGALQPYQS